MDMINYKITEYNNYNNYHNYEYVSLP